MKILMKNNDANDHASYHAADVAANNLFPTALFRFRGKRAIYAKRWTNCAKAYHALSRVGG